MSNFVARLRVLNDRVQHKFVRSMAATRGFVANPKIAVSAYSDYRAARRKRFKERWERYRREQLAMTGHDPGVKPTWRQWWLEFREGTEVVWRPVTKPLRMRIAKAKDFARSFKPGPFPSAGTQAPQPAKRPNPNTPNTTTTWLVAAQDTSQRLTHRATSLGRHFQEFMLDPNFKRRQFAHKLRRWQPSTRAGRAMAPLALAICFCLPIIGGVYWAFAVTLLDRDRKHEMLKKQFLLRSDPTASLGLPSELKKIDRNEDEALLEIYTVRRWR
ncbi:hypothetical protein DIPPA_11213 [Diplonema papillatum]|nr:hypothetical protein DIPPA_11213 [Diplonema papillatum]